MDIESKSVRPDFDAVRLGDAPVGRASEMMAGLMQDADGFKVQANPASSFENTQNFELA